MEDYFGQIRLVDDANDDIENDKSYIIRMKNIHKTYLLGIEGVPALRGVDVKIKKGEFIVVFGTSGGGKTTLLNVMGTIDRPTKGEMTLFGSLINHNTPDKVLSDLRLHHIGFVFQTFNLISALTALQNVEMPMILKGQLSKKQRRKKAKLLLKNVAMDNRLHHLPSELSGGEQQRVTIARAMSNNPQLIFLDEPTGDLDTENSNIVMDMLIQLNKNDNITLVMVTHDVGLKYYADRVIWMRDGRIMRTEVIPEPVKQEKRNELREIVVEQQKKKPPVEQKPAEELCFERNSIEYRFHECLKPIDKSLYHKEEFQICELHV